MQHWDELTIDNFSGPLDLLWNMIKDKKIDIQHVQLIEIVDQYLNYLHTQTTLDIEIASEYLVMASQLIEFKSRKLLPHEDAIPAEDEFQFEDLLEKVTQYGQIKGLTDFFYTKQEEYLSTFSKPKTKKSFSQFLIKHNDAPVIDPLNLDINDFADIFRDVIQRLDHPDVDFHDSWGEEDVFDPLQQEIISPQIIAKSIVNVMKQDKYKSWRLDEVIQDYELNLLNLICTFLAMLDMVKHQLAIVTQTEHNLEFAFTQAVINDEQLLERIQEDIENEQQT